MISYTQKTWKAASGVPMHAESGYWRPRPDGSVDVVIAQSTGLAEVQVSSLGQLASSLQASLGCAFLGTLAQCYLHMCHLLLHSFGEVVLMYSVSIFSCVTETSIDPVFLCRSCILFMY